MAATGETDTSSAFTRIEDNITELVERWIKDCDPSIPIILTAHASVEGATFGGERLVMLGSDIVLSGSLVKDPRLDYVALGHIHKPQNLNENAHPPVIYPGSIERVDFGEAKDDKFFIIAEVTRGSTQVQWIKLDGARPFIDRRAVLESGENVTEFLKSALPKAREISGAIIRLTVEYPREFDTLIDDSALRKYCESAFEFHLVKRPQIQSRTRIAEGQVVSSLSPFDLLEQYFDASKTRNTEELQQLARQIISDDEGASQ
jgi:exonuclease SbcD